MYREDIFIKNLIERTYLVLEVLMPFPLKIG